MKVCVVGLGKLGSVLAATLASKGHEVIGLDVSESIVTKINQARAPVCEPGLTALIASARTNLRATTDAQEAVEKSKIAFIVVPTPSDGDGRFSNDYIYEALKRMGPHVSGWYTFVICSTVMPGACDGPIKEAVEASTGRLVGVDVGLCYSPEFIALGSVVHDMTHPDLVLLGANDRRSQRDLFAVLATVPQNQPRFLALSMIDAELAKIAINTYVTMKISFANTLGEICEALPGADGLKVADAVGADGRIGLRYLRPGGSYGGPCFPRDTTAFSALARQCGTRAELAEATDVINRRQVIRWVERFRHYDRVAILGKSYKSGTPVVEESFAAALTKLLQFEGVRVVGYDPLVSQDIYGSEVAESAQDAVDRTEAVIVATNHESFKSLDFKEKPVLDVWGILPASVKALRIGIAES